eukprot:NODE_30_length_37342_cov_0.449507.p27 type:complete len:113 gc:universal NODE_30_length_37342_cov_0.449507:4566-4904(+)
MGKPSLNIPQWTFFDLFHLRYLHLACTQKILMAKTFFILLEIRFMIDQTLRIKILDGRVFIGKLLAVDKERNLVFGESVEMSQGKDEFVVARKTGLIMISGKDIEKIWKNSA